MELIVPNKYKSIIEKITTLALEMNVNVYIVGGFIRDIIMKREPKDLDIMIDMPNGGILFAEALSKKHGESNSLVVFPRFGTAQLNIDGELVEFVMPRSEYYYEDSRKPDTQYTSVEADALRRDFAMNAIFYRLNDGEFLDYTNHGLWDIHDKLISVTEVGSEDIIFTQDPLRMLRAIRFDCQLNFNISDLTWQGIERNVEKIKTISSERIRDELNKILLSEYPTRGIELLRSSKLIDYIIPEINDIYNLEQPEEYHHKDVYDHTLLVLGNVKNDLNLRLAALLHDIGKPVKREIIDGKIHFYEHEKASADIARNILTRLKYPNDIIDDVCFIITNHMRPHSFKGNWSDSAVRRFIIDMGEHLNDVIEIVKADVTSSSPNNVINHLNSLIELMNRIIEVEKVAKSNDIKPLLNGNELMVMFNMPEGRWIKILHEKLIDKQLENPLMTKDEAKVFVREVIGDNPIDVWAENYKIFDLALKGGEGNEK